MLSRALFLLCAFFVLALPAGVSGASPPSPEEVERQVHRRINALRQEEGLPPLAWNPALAEIARGHSRRMARENFFSHADPSGKEVNDRLRDAGIAYSAVGENIFQSAGYPDPAQAAVRGWMKSPGHRANILRREFTQGGVGVWQEKGTTTITHVFRRPR